MPVYRYKTARGNRYYIKCSIHGKRKCVRGFETKQLALAYEATMFKNSSKAKVSNNYRIDDLIPIYFDIINNKIKITSAHSKIGIFNHHLLPYFKGLHVYDIEPNFLNSIAKEINNKKYKKKHLLFSMLKEFLKFLMNFGLDPGLNMSMLYPKYQSNVEPIKFDYYTREEFVLFSSCIDSPKYKLVFILLFDYGLRIGELLALKHQDFTKDRVFIRHAIASKLGNGQVETTPKTKTSIRDFPLINSVRNAYIDYLKELDGYKKEDYLFKSDKPNTLTIGESPIRNAQKKYEKLSGAKHIKLHEFRHSCASELINNGFTPEQVAAWLGHSSSAITLKIYAHLFPSRKMEIANFYNSL